MIQSSESQVAFLASVLYVSLSGHTEKLGLQIDAHAYAPNLLYFFLFPLAPAPRVRVARATRDVMARGGTKGRDDKGGGGRVWPSIRWGSGQAAGRRPVATAVGRIVCVSALH